MSAQWTITNPAGAGVIPLDIAGGAEVVVNFRIMAASQATVTVHRDYDSEEGWWEADSIVTIYRNLVPYFTGRVLESPANATPASEIRTLHLADAWLDLEDVTYQEEWAIGSGSVLIPKVILGKNPAGEDITTGAQIRAAVAYAISQDAAMQLGTVEDGVAVWPSEAVNISCADVILGELRWNPQYAAWLDHSTSPPTFRCRTASALAARAVDIAAENVESFAFSKLVRTIPRGIRILYEDAVNIDGEIYRNGYLDTAGETTGRRIMHATIELAGLDQQNQKSRIRTRTIPAEGADALAAQKTFLKQNFPTLASIPDAQWTLKNFKTELAADPGAHPKPISGKAARLTPDEKSDIPRQLVNGSVEDWMRKKVGQINVSYDLEDQGADALDPLLGAFLGKGKSFTVTATNAVTKLYKSTSSFTEGEGRPVGIAAAVFAAATAEKHEGSIVISGEDVPATAWLGSTVRLLDGEAQVMPPAVIHSATADITAGTVALEFGPLPYLSAGDFLELQRMAKGRPVKWMSQEERASNQIGAEDAPGAKGDTVSGYDFPAVISPPGGGNPTPSPFWPTLSGSVAVSDLKISMVDGFLKNLLIGDEDDAAVNVIITSIPDNESTEIGRKYWVTATESQDGKISEASVGNGAAWPDSTAPQPIGGDDQVGESGTRNWRLCEVVADGDEAKMKIWRTGHIHHDAMRRLENTVTSAPSESEEMGRLVKAFDKATGQWEIRVIQGIEGITVEEAEGSIRIGGGGSALPLTVTSGEGKLSVSAGSYQVGVYGAWVPIPASAPTVGTHVYFVVVQDESLNVISATIEIGGVRSPIVMSGSPETPTSNILIYDGVQRRHGNFTLSLWQIGGDVVWWAETLAGGA